MKTLVITSDIDQYENWLSGRSNISQYSYASSNWHFTGMERCGFIKLSGWQQGKSKSFLNAVHNFEKKQANLRYAKNKLKKRKPVRKVSTFRAVQLRAYAKLSKKWKVGKVCRICGGTPVDIHHRNGRSGLLLLIEDFFIPLCREHHNSVKTHPEWALSNGLLPEKGQYNSIPKEKS